MRLANDKVGLAIADVSGKGVPAALFMMSSRTLLKGSAIGNLNPGETLREVNDLLCEDNEAMMFVTLLYAVYDPPSGNLSYANGGHNTPVVVHADGSYTVLPMTGGIALGVMPDFEFEQGYVKLMPGDTLVLYTDGVTEAMNEDGEEYGMERLCEILAAAPSIRAQDISDTIFESIREFAGEAPQSDDITCLTLHRSEVGA